MKVTAYCEQCRHQHGIDFDPLKPNAEFSDWYIKHQGHSGVWFDWPQRSRKSSISDMVMRAWKFAKTRIGVAAIALMNGHAPPNAIAAFLHNANVKTSYAASAAITCGVASLASSSGKLAGRESNSVDNTSNLYLDYLLSGKITVGTTPTTATSIDVCVVGTQDDTPTWPDVFDGTDSAETVTTQEIKDQICKPFQTLSIISTTSDIGQYYGPGSVASRFGGVVPKLWVLFIAHNTGANLNATGGNHVQSQIGVYLTVV